jgi:hypothetical protein
VFTPEKKNSLKTRQAISGVVSLDRRIGSRENNILPLSMGTMDIYVQRLCTLNTYWKYSKFFKLCKVFPSAWREQTHRFDE